MKKQDDGYVMAYVTVVLLLFCMIATMLLSGAMKNMQTQQNAIAQMRDRYAAEGLIERAIAEETDIEGVTIESADGTKTITATYGTATIVCVMNSDNEVVSYQVSYGIGGEADATDASH